jgi:hypothetical protein
MKITCEYGEFEILGYREPGSKRIDRAVPVESLANALGLSLKRLPMGPGVRYVELDGVPLVPINDLNAWLIAVRAHPEVINRLSLHLSERSSRDIGFLSYAHIHLQEALTALGGYYTETGLDAEYPVDEVEDRLYEIYCEFLTCGSYDPLLMERDRQPMTSSEAWMLSILESTTAALILDFIDKKMDPENILLFLQVELKERVTMIGSRVAEMASTFVTPDEL